MTTGNATGINPQTNTNIWHCSSLAECVSTSLTGLISFCVWSLLKQQIILTKSFLKYCWHKEQSGTLWLLWMQMLCFCFSTFPSRRLWHPRWQLLDGDSFTVEDNSPINHELTCCVQGSVIKKKDQNRMNVLPSASGGITAIYPQRRETDKIPEILWTTCTYRYSIYYCESSSWCVGCSAGACSTVSLLASCHISKHVWQSI